MKKEKTKQTKKAKTPGKLKDLEAKKPVRGGSGTPRAIDMRIAMNHNETFLEVS